MKKKKKMFQYSLIISFFIGDGETIYSGPIQSNKSIEEKLEVNSDNICLSFKRAKQQTVESRLLSSGSILRPCLQKAMCFYTGVKGEVPQVKEIYAIENGKRVEIVDKSFLQNWAHGRCNRQFPVYILTPIFFVNDKGKAVYVALSYWLKAQLSELTNDKFRFFWSGYNTIYSYYYPKIKKTIIKYEFDQLLAFAKGNRSETYPESLQKVNEIEDSFYSRFSKGTYATDISNFQDDNLVKLNYLIRRIIYIERCKYFHGAKEYPLFMIQPLNHKTTYDILTELLEIYLFETLLSMDNRIRL